MSILKELKQYKRICIQCHDNPDPDALASAYGLYCYFSYCGIPATIIYGGNVRIRKYSIELMIEECGIPISYVTELPACDLLVTVDCQYGSGNVTQFKAEHIAVIDHHCPIRNYAAQQKVTHYFVDENYQSCATIIWEMLEEESVSTREFIGLDTALAYGLFIDTASYKDLRNNVDLQMKIALNPDVELLEHLEKCNIKIEELGFIGNALCNNWFNEKNQWMIIPMHPNCDPVLLAITADFTQQVDTVKLSVAYTENIECYYFSIRCSYSRWNAADLARQIAAGVGSGGGHRMKAAGRLYKEKFLHGGTKQEVEALLHQRIESYCEHALQESAQYHKDI